jgi:hypothetical protein
MRKIITYAYDTGTGLVISRVGSQVAISVLRFDKMTPENNFNTEYELEKISVFAILRWDNYKWTKKVPVDVKNQHRKFWGMKKI